MSIWRRGWPYLVLAILLMPAAWPFTQPGLPRTNDNIPHLLRLVELDQLVRAGVLFPRWGPDLALGYGYPVFNFFPYFSHYLAEIFHLLGLSFLNAFKAVYILDLLCAAFFTYRLGREHFGQAAGLAAGVAYACSPYFLYNVHIRGALPETTALAILPLAFLSVRHAARGQRRALAAAAASIGGLLFAHNAVSLQALPFLGLYGLWEALMDGSAGPRPRRLAFVGAAFLLGLALSAFYWFPALTEIASVQFDNAVRNGSLQYFDHLLPLSELFALPRLPVDPDLLNPPVVRSLPLAALALAAASALRAIARVIRRALGPVPPGWIFALTYLLPASILAVFLILPASRPLWDFLPLLRLSLFPWRLLGPASLFVSLLAGALFHQDGEKGNGGSTPTIAIASALAFLVICGLPFASPPLEAAPDNPTLTDLAGFEIPPDLIGTTTAAEFLPAGVRQLPDLLSDRERILRGEVALRYDLQPAAGDSTFTRPGPLRAEFELDLPAPAVLTYRVFYFPGWRASLDGQPIPIRVTYPEGLMAVELPAGRHALRFDFGSTPVRTTASLASLAAALAALGLWLWPARRAARPWPDAPIPAQGLPLIVLALCLAAARPWLYDAGRTPLLRRGLGAQGLAGVAHPASEDFAGELTLLGWEARPLFISGEQVFRLDLYWRANQPLGVAYGFHARLADEAGFYWSSEEIERPRDWRFIPGTDFWPPDQYVMDSYMLHPAPGTPPGEYDVDVKAFAFFNLQSIGAVRLGPLAVTRPARAGACGSGSLGVFEGGLQLRSMELSAAQARPGDDVTAALCWEVLRAPGAGAEAEMALLGAEGQTGLSHIFQLGGRYPASEWRPGDVIREQVRVRLPAGLPGGEHTWVLRLGSVTAPVGTLRVEAPERVFTAPPGVEVLNADLGWVSLYGAELPGAPLQTGQPLAVRLAWQAGQTTPEPYHVFVHLMDPSGQLRAQSDGVPADWSRPTTGWLPGEFVAETRTLWLPADAPPGEYTLWAGLYRPEDGQRMTSAAFPDGRILLGTVNVSP